MTPQDQEFAHITGEQYGDCMRACIASLLDLPIADVPHWLQDCGGITHAVIGKDGVIVFDPHPSKAGLAGDPAEWRYDYLIPVQGIAARAA